MKSIVTLTVKEIKFGALKSILPELYELKMVYETGDWHNHQPVFDHILQVFSFIKKYSRNNLLLWAGLLHDIGKKDSIPNHVLVGTRLTRKILIRLKVSRQERHYIVTVVKNHGLATDLQQIMKLQSKSPQLFKDLLIFGLADTQGSNLKQNNPQDYQRRVKFYRSHLRGVI